MIDPRFVILAALLPIAGSAAYAWDTLHGRTQPNRVTWGLWTVAPLIAFGAELTQQVGLQSLLTFAVGFGPLLVLLASFADAKAYARLTPLDITCGALSLVALAAWAITGTGNVAILFSILSDFFGAIPTVRKAYAAPHTESAAVFIASAVGAVITLLTIKPADWGFATAAFPAYIVLGASTIATLILIPRRGGGPADVSDGAVGGATSRRRARRAASGG
jgi:hypothetical protein